MRVLLVVVLLWPAVLQAFNLDTRSAHWIYTTEKLANTTSVNCKRAYSAEITCDDYLIQLVDADEEPAILDSMAPEDFNKTCTSVCQNSINTYILNVKQTCTEPGDRAIRSMGPNDHDGQELVPVSTIGAIFRYRLMRSCARDLRGEICFIQQHTEDPDHFKSIEPPPESACDAMSCGMAYYWNARKYAGSLWTIGDTSVVASDSATNRRLNGVNDKLFFNAPKNESILQGWKQIMQCGYGNATSAPFDSGIAKVPIPDDDIRPETTAVSSGSSIAMGLWTLAALPMLMMAYPAV